MFEFLKNLGKPHLIVQDYGSGVVRFRAGKSLKVGETIEGIADFPNGKRMDLQVQVVQRGPEYAGKVLGPKETVEMLEQSFLPHLGDEKEQMYYKVGSEEATHHMRTYAVRSRSLPNFRALTSEVSMEEATLVLDGQVQEGVEMTLQMDLDDPGLPPISLEAKVEWCKQRDDRFWVAHLAITSISEAQRPVLKQFLADLKERRPGSASTLDRGNSAS